MATSEDIQTLILTTLDSQGVIENTDSLKTADGAAIPYLAVVGVLNSLASKEVNDLTPAQPTTAHSTTLSGLKGDVPVLSPPQEHGTN